MILKENLLSNQNVGRLGDILSGATIDTQALGLTDAQVLVDDAVIAAIQNGDLILVIDGEDRSQAQTEILWNLGAAACNGQLFYEQHVTTEESATLDETTENGYQWSYGNGEVTIDCGWVINIPDGFKAQLVGCTFNTLNAVDASFDVAINKTAQGLHTELTTSSENKKSWRLTTPIDLATDDLITPRTHAVTGGTPGDMNTFTMIIRYTRNG